MDTVNKCSSVGSNFLVGWPLGVRGAPGRGQGPVPLTGWRDRAPKIYFGFHSLFKPISCVLRVLRQQHGATKEKTTNPQKMATKRAALAAPAAPAPTTLKCCIIDPNPPSRTGLLPSGRQNSINKTLIKLFFLLRDKCCFCEMRK